MGQDQAPPAQASMQEMPLRRFQPVWELAPLAQAEATQEPSVATPEQQSV